MSGLEQGIELTFKTIMKVKDDEIDRLKKSFQMEAEILYAEINQRDVEIDQLKEELLALKSDKKMIDKDSKYLRKIHQNEMDDLKKKCDLELASLRTRNAYLEAKVLDIQTQNFRMQSIALEVKEKHVKEIQKIKDEGVANMSNLRTEKQILTAKLEGMKQKIRNDNIAIFKDVWQRFGCRAAWDIALLFMKIPDSNGRMHRNGQVQDVGDGKFVLRVYGDIFKSCINCRSFPNQQCCYKKQNWQPKF